MEINENFFIYSILKRQKKIEMAQETSSKMKDFNPTISIMISHINYLNIPNKRQRLSDQIKNKIQVYTVQQKPSLNVKKYIY